MLAPGAAWYCSTTLARMRPRALTAKPRSFARTARRNLLGFPLRITASGPGAQTPPGAPAGRVGLPTRQCSSIAAEHSQVW